MKQFRLSHQLLVCLTSEFGSFDWCEIIFCIERTGQMHKNGQA